METINKIAIISDLHLDFWTRFYQQKPGVNFYSLFNIVLDKCIELKPDLIIIAGDVSNNFVNTPGMWETDIPILYVPGNHDYYGRTIPEIPYIYKDNNIFASTLWTNFGNSSAAPLVYRGIADSTQIKNTSAWQVRQLMQDTWSELRKADKEIVVTHFPAFSQSISEKYRGDLYNIYFVNAMEYEWQNNPGSTKLWVAGHVHHKHTYKMGDMLFICNPLGYPNENYHSITQYEPVLVEKQDDKWVITK